jgi:hypothetical protein
MLVLLFDRMTLVGLGLILLLASFAGPGFAEALVVTSSAPGIEAGQKLDEKAIIEIPANATVEVLVMPENTMRVVKGPCKGTLFTCKPECPFWRLDGCPEAGSHSAEGGGTRSRLPREQPPGGVRGLRPQ